MADSTAEAVDAPEDVAATLAANEADLAEALETIARLQRTGTLDDLASMADMLALLTAATTDEMATELSATGGRLMEVADTAAEDDVAGGLEDALAAVGDASAEDPERVGLVGLLRATRDPEVQAGLGFVIALARALGERRLAETESPSR